MADVGGLVADIGLNVAGLRQDIKASNRELQRGTNKMNRHLGSLRRKVDGVTRGFKGLAGAISVALLARHMKSTVDAADQMLKLTQRIGGTTESLSELEFVAERSGIAFNTLTMGLQRMVRRVAEAAAGTGEAKAALKELRLDAQQLKTLAIDQQFEVIADALFGVKNESDRVRLAMKLFDSEGVALLQTMTNGAEGIRELRGEAQKLGVTLSQDQAEAAMRAQDALTNLSAQVSSLTRNMTLGLVPAIEAVVTGWNSLLFNASPFPFQQQIDNAEKALSLLQAKLGTIKGDFGPDSPVTAMQLEIAGEILDVSNLIDELNEKQKQALGLIEAPAPKVQTSESRKAGTETAKAFTEGFNTELNGPLVSDTLIPKPTADQVFKLRDIVDPAFDDLEEKAKDTADTVDEKYNGLAQSIGFSLQRSFSDSFLGIETSFGDMIRRMAADFLASKLVNSIRSLGEGMPGPIGTLLSALPGFKDGGSFTVGGGGGPDSQLVAFRATPGERVDISNSPQSEGGRLGVVHQQFNISTAIPAQLEAAIRNIAGASGRDAALQLMQAQRGRI